MLFTYGAMYAKSLGAGKTTYVTRQHEANASSIAIRLQLHPRHLVKLVVPHRYP